MISNPRSHGNRRSGGIAAGVGPAAGLSLVSPRCREELAETLRAFAGGGVGLIAVDGGDGTVRDVLGELDEAYGDAWPLFALLPSGKTNAVAADVGHSGTGAAGLRRLLAARDAGTLGRRRTDRPALEVAARGTSGGLGLRGFVLGAAAFSDGVRLANESLHPAGIVKGLAVALAIGGVLRRGIGAREGAPGETATIRVDGRAVNGRRHFLLLASTLERLTLGIRPFWDEGAGPVNWLDVSAPPVRPVRGLTLIAFGRRRAWMERSGYASGRARRIEMELERSFVLDGEAFCPEGGALTVSATRPIGFVRA